MISTQKLTRCIASAVLVVALLTEVATPTVMAQETVTVIGTTVSAPVANLPGFGSTASSCELAFTGAEPYMLYTLSVDDDVQLSIDISEPIDLLGVTDDTMLFLYDAPFNSSDACSSFIELGNVGPGTGMAVEVVSTVNYVLAVGGFLGSQDAFELKITGPLGSNITVDPLPIELAGFSAVVDADNVNLNWTVLSELNNSGFEIQQAIVGQGLASIGSGEGNGAAGQLSDASSIGGHDFSPIAFVESASGTGGQQEYNFIIEGLDVGTYLFRLKQIDTDGTSTYYDAVEAVIGLQSPFEVSEVFPNPATHRATIKVAVAEEQLVSVTAFDLLGRRVGVPFRRAVSPGARVDVVFETGSLPRGSYYLVISGDRFQATRSVTIVR